MIWCAGEHRLHGACNHYIRAHPCRICLRCSVLADMTDILVKIRCIRAFKMLASTHICRLVALCRTLIMVHHLILLLLVSPVVFRWCGRLLALLNQATVVLGIWDAQIILVHRVNLLQACQRSNMLLLFRGCVAAIWWWNYRSACSALGKTIDGIRGKGYAICCVASTQWDNWSISDFWSSQAAAGQTIFESFSTVCGADLRRPTSTSSSKTAKVLVEVLSANLFRVERVPAIRTIRLMRFYLLHYIPINFIRWEVFYLI